MKKILSFITGIVLIGALLISCSNNVAGKATVFPHPIKFSPH